MRCPGLHLQFPSGCLHDLGVAVAEPGKRYSINGLRSSSPEHSNKRCTHVMQPVDMTLMPPDRGGSHTESRTL